MGCLSACFVLMRPLVSDSISCWKKGDIETSSDTKEFRQHGLRFESRNSNTMEAKEACQWEYQFQENNAIASIEHLLERSCRLVKTA